MDKTQEMGQETIKTLLGKDMTRLTRARYQNRPRPIKTLSVEAEIPREFSSSLALRFFELRSICDDAIVLLYRLNNLGSKFAISSENRKYFGTIHCGIVRLTITYYFDRNDLVIELVATQETVLSRLKLRLTPLKNGLLFEECIVKNS